MASYTVKPGDTLSGIAQKVLGSASRWGELGYSGDPRKLAVGTVLNYGGGGSAPAAQGGGGASLSGRPMPTFTSLQPGYNFQQDWNTLYGQQKSQNDQIFNESIDPLKQQSKNIMSAAEASAQSIRDLAPSISNIYTKQAERLENQRERHMEQQTTEKTMDLGAAARAAAANGMDPTQGYAAALQRATADQYDKKLLDISESYGIEADILNAQHAKTLQELTVEANNALLQGNMAVADVLGQIAAMKQQYQQFLTESTYRALSARSEQESLALSAWSAEQEVAHQQRMLELEAESIEIQRRGVSLQERQYEQQQKDAEELRKLLTPKTYSGSGSAANPNSRAGQIAMRERQAQLDSILGGGGGSGLGYQSGGTVGGLTTNRGASALQNLMFGQGINDVATPKKPVQQQSINPFKGMF